MFKNKKDKKVSKKSAKKSSSNIKNTNSKNNDIKQIVNFSLDNSTNLFKLKDKNYIKTVSITGTNLWGIKEDDINSLIHSFSRLFGKDTGTGQLYIYQTPISINDKLRDIELLKTKLNLDLETDKAKFNILCDNQDHLKTVCINSNLIDYHFIVVLKDKDLTNLNKKVSSVINSQSGITTARELSLQEMKMVLFNYYHPSSSITYRKESSNSHEFMDLLLPDSFEKMGFGNNSVVCSEGIYYKFRYISNFTKDLNQNGLAILNRVSTLEGVDFSLHFSPTDESSINSVIDKNINSIRKELDNTTLKQSEIALKQKDLASAEQVIETINYDGNMPVNFGVYIRIKGDTKEEVLEKNKFVTDVLKNQSGITTRETFFELEQMYNTVAPICSNEVENYQLTSTTVSLSAMYPIISESLYDEQQFVENGVTYNMPPILLGNTTCTNGAIFYDNFMRKGTRANFNEFVAGTSGHGKTTMLMSLIEDRLARGYKQHVIDVEGKELNKLTKSLKGTVLDCANGDNGRINPLQVRINIYDSDDEDTQKVDLDRIFPLSEHMRYISSFFETYSNNDKSLSLEHFDTLKEEIEILYRNMGITYDTPASTIIKDYNNSSYPIFKDLFDVIENKIANEESKPTKDLMKINSFELCRKFIRPLATGEDSNLFNGATNIDLTNDLICYNLSALQNNTSSATLKAQYFNILSYIWSTVVSNNGQQRIQIYADEFSVIVDKNNEQLLIYFRNMIKRARKYYTGITSATQQIQDIIIDSVKEYTLSMISESCYKFFFKLSTEGANYLIDGETLPVQEKDFLLTAQIGECYASFGQATALRMSVELEPNRLHRYSMMKDRDYTG